jgi:hypothetical protein
MQELTLSQSFDVVGGGDSFATDLGQFVGGAAVGSLLVPVVPFFGVSIAIALGVRAALK